MLNVLYVGSMFFSVRHLEYFTFEALTHSSDPVSQCTTVLKGDHVDHLVFIPTLEVLNLEMRSRKGHEGITSAHSEDNLLESLSVVSGHDARHMTDVDTVDRVLSSCLSEGLVQRVADELTTLHHHVFVL